MTTCSSLGSAKGRPFIVNFLFALQWNNRMKVLRFLKILPNYLKPTGKLKWKMHARLANKKINHITYILLHVLLCGIAEYFYELCRILVSP